MTTIFVTAGQEPSQTSVFQTVVVTAIQSATSSASPQATSTAISAENSLPVSWILAIVAFVLLAIESTVLAIIYWRKPRSKQHGLRNSYDPRQSRVYEMSWPSDKTRTRHSRISFQGHR